MFKITVHMKGINSSAKEKKHRVTFKTFCSVLKIMECYCSAFTEIHYETFNPLFNTTEVFSQIK